MEEKESNSSEGAESTDSTGRSEDSKRLLGNLFSDELRYTLDRRYPLVLGALLLLTLSGGYVAYTAHTTTETVTQERVVSVWSTSTEFNHGVTVQRNAIVFEKGVELEDRTVYFRSLSPVLNGTYSVRHGGDEPQPATVRAELTLVLRSVGDGGTEFWRESRRLGVANDSSLESGETLRANFSVNVTEATDRINEIQRNLSASPGSTQILVSADTAVEGEVSGGGYTDTRSEMLRIKPGSGTYSVSTNVEGEKSEQMTETFETPIEPSFLNAYVSVLLTLVSFGIASSLFWAKRKGLLEIPPENVRRILFEKQREELDEWISQGSVSGGSKPTEIEFDSLEGLVDVAIDSNRRVTETEDGSYIVLIGDVMYFFEPDFGEDSTGQGETRKE